MKTKEELAENYVCENLDDLDILLNTVAHKKTFLEGFKAALKQGQNLPISNVKLSCLQEVWQAWCESDKTTEFDTWLHDKLHEA